MEAQQHQCFPMRPAVDERAALHIYKWAPGGSSVPALGDPQDHNTLESGAG